jgi:hypothetical protein
MGSPGAVLDTGCFGLGLPREGVAMAELSAGWAGLALGWANRCLGWV